jgi:trigger factor
MHVTVEDVSSIKKMLHIEIPQDEVARELEKAYNQLKKSAKIKGFRPGKAPRSVLERLFKKNVHADVSSRLIQNSFVDAIRETELKIVGNPQIDPPELNIDGPYIYDATVEITPNIDDIDFKGLSLKRTQYRVSDSEVEAQLKMLQKNMAKYQSVSDNRATQDGDFVLIDYEGLNEGMPVAEFSKQENFKLKIGENAISEDFDSQLIGMKPGDTKEMKVRFPEDYFNEKLANLEISFNVILKEIREEILPEINDELAKSAGPYETLDQLKKVISDNLEQGYEKRVEQELNEQIFSELIVKTKFEVPDVMVEMELEGIIEEAERSFAYRNTSLEEMGLSREKIAEKYRDTALKQVKRHLILSKIIDQESLTLADDELENGLKEMSAGFNQPLEEIKKYYDENKDKLEFFKHTLLEKKAINLIIDNSKIEGVSSEKEKKEAKNKRKNL